MNENEIRLTAAVMEAHAVYHVLLLDLDGPRDFRDCDQPSCRIASGQLPVGDERRERILAASEAGGR